MKISKGNEFTSLNNENDFMNMINKFQEKYGEVYWNHIEGQIFVYRALGRIEYKQLLNAEISDIEKEDVVCKACLLYPSDYDLDNCNAGIPTTLFKFILKNSFLDSLESKKLIVAYHRAEMESFDNQITCIINEAFPNIDIEEIENWDMSKTAKYLSRAEWKLNVLRQIPVDYDVSDKLMENEWAHMHIKNDDKSVDETANNKSKIQPDLKNDNPNNEKLETIIGETLEERAERLKKQGPKKKSKEELERLKRAFPDVNWDAQVTEDDMKQNVDSTSCALRPGW